jgi:hypothetical protein
MLIVQIFNPIPSFGFGSKTVDLIRCPVFLWRDNNIPAATVFQRKGFVFWIRMVRHRNLRPRGSEAPSREGGVGGSLTEGNGEAAALQYRSGSLKVSFSDAGASSASEVHARDREPHSQVTPGPAEMAI